GLGRHIVGPLRKRRRLGLDPPSFFDGLDVQSLFVAKVVLDAGDIDPGPLANLAHGGALEPLVGEDRSGSVKQASAGVVDGHKMRKPQRTTGLNACLSDYIKHMFKNKKKSRSNSRFRLFGKPLTSFNSAFTS